LSKAVVDCLDRAEECTAVYTPPQRPLAEDRLDQLPGAVKQRIKCRASMVEIFPNNEAVERLVGAVLVASRKRL